MGKEADIFEHIEKSIGFFKRTGLLASNRLRLDQIGIEAGTTTDGCRVLQEVIRLLDDDRIHFHPSSNPILVAHPDRLQDIFLELLINAKDFAPEVDGRIQVDINSDAETARFEIKDNGHGIHPELRPQLFQMFRRFPASRMGLGLHYARSLARAMGGDVTEIGTDSGAHFVVSLPLKK